MSILISIAIGLLAFVAAGGVAGFYYMRRIYREQKNYERGLKMVPLLIHLPPVSEDADSNGRDARDLVEENISRAQVLYGILASTFQKGFKSRLYGQRHISLEIVASKGLVHFYAAVPVPLLGIVEQAVVSAYPSARLEEAPEHNIFSPVGRISGTMGGELTLKEGFSYPIATYQDLKRDTMQALLNALSTLSKEDGAGVQILLRPADSSWRKAATSEADKKRKGGGGSTGIEKTLGGVGQVISALTKPPETKDSKAEERPHELSTLDQSVIQAIEEKTKQPAFEVMIRVVASSNITHRAQTVLNNIVATFSLYDAPGRNGFKLIPAKDIDSFVTAYILRFFPQGQSKNILNTTELATLFHFPDQKNIPTSQLERQASKQVDGPRNVPEHGLLLGYNMFRGAKKAIRLDLNDRRRHMYVVGQTGTGKSVFMENLALQDMLDGRGFAFIDPHGDTAERLLSMVPKERTEDVIYFCPADMDYPLGLNMFEFNTPEQKDFLIQEAINMLYKLYDPGHTGIIGPRYEHLFRNAALTVMAGPEGGSFVDIPKLFRDPAYVEQKLKHVTDQNVIEFWRKEMPQSQRSNEFGEVVSWFISKFGAFMSNEMMRNIIGQTKSSFDLRQVMDENKILLVNLSRGRTGDLNSKLLGMIFVMKFQAAAMSRADIPEDMRRDFCLYVDEFQNFSTDSFAEILSEARKYRLNVIVANQFMTQLTEEVRDSVIGNVGSVVSFRVGTNDAEFLSKQFAPIFDIDDLQFLPNYNTVVRMMIGGVPVQPFSMATLPPLGEPNKQLGDALKQLSAAKYGRPKGSVEAAIFKRLTTNAPALPTGRPGMSGGDPFAALRSPTASTGAPSSMPPPGGRLAAPTPASSSPGSFLDEWLAKRSQGAHSVPGQAATIRPSPNNQPTSPRPLGDNLPSVPTAGDHMALEAEIDNPNKTEQQADHKGYLGEMRIQREHHEHEEPSAKGSGSDKVKAQATSIEIDKDGNLSVGE